MEKKSISVNRDELKCFYINARNILNKFDEFEAWVYDINPDIIGVKRELDREAYTRLGTCFERL